MSDDLPDDATVYVRRTPCGGREVFHDDPECFVLDGVDFLTCERGFFPNLRLCRYCDGLTPGQHGRDDSYQQLRGLWEEAD